MIRLTFSFPTPAHASDFAEECLDSSTQHHRVVEVETTQQADARDLARRHGGRE